MYYFSGQILAGKETEADEQEKVRQVKDLFSTYPQKYLKKRRLCLIKDLNFYIFV